MTQYVILLLYTAVAYCCCILLLYTAVVLRLAAQCSLACMLGRGPRMHVTCCLQPISAALNHAELCLPALT